MDQNFKEPELTGTAKAYRLKSAFRVDCKPEEIFDEVVEFTDSVSLKHIIASLFDRTNTDAWAEALIS